MTPLPTVRQLERWPESKRAEILKHFAMAIWRDRSTLTERHDDTALRRAARRANMKRRRRLHERADLFEVYVRQPYWSWERAQAALEAGR